MMRKVITLIWLCTIVLWISGCGYLWSKMQSITPATGSLCNYQDISGLKLWFKADAITGLSNGQAVSTWVDSSGNGFNATQAGGLRPLYMTNILNGKPVVRFDGADDSLQITGFTYSGVLSFFIVSKQSVGSDTSQFVTVDGAGNVTFESMNLIIGGYETVSFLATAAGTGIGYSPPGFVGTWNLETVIWNGGGHAASNYTASYNGASQTVVLSGAFGHGVEVSSIGNRINQGTYMFNGDIAEIVFFSEVISTSNRQRIETCLNQKYALY